MATESSASQIPRRELLRRGMVLFKALRKARQQAKAAQQQQARDGDKKKPDSVAQLEKLCGICMRSE